MDWRGGVVPAMPSNGIDLVRRSLRREPSFLKEVLASGMSKGMDLARQTAVSRGVGEPLPWFDMSPVAVSSLFSLPTK